jgi:cytolysin-activating lysine-acyltransferase
MSKKSESGSAVSEKPRVNGTDVADTSKADAASPSAPISPEILAKLAEVRTKIQANVGEVVLAMMNLPRYRHQTLGDLMHLVLEPLMRDRIAIAKSGGEGKAEETAGIAIWASVSDEVDQKIREQVKAGAFPVRLQSDDWASGENAWLLDVIAPNQKVATAVLANFKQVVKDRPVRIHPIVARAVDPAVLEKMKAGSAGDENEAKPS